MPIQFRCPHCTRLLGVARRKAGAQVRCPRCGRPATVPGGEAGPFDDLDDDTGPAQTADPARQARAGGTVGMVADPPTRPAADRPLFEADDLDAILGVKPAAEALDLDDDDSSGPRPVSGADAGTLTDDGLVILTHSKAKRLGAVLAGLVLVAFVLGIVVGRNW